MLGEIPRNVQALRLKQEERENMNQPIHSNEIESVIKRKLPTNKSPGSEDFTGGFYKTFREELIPSLLKLFQTNAEERGNASEFIM